MNTSFAFGVAPFDWKVSTVAFVNTIRKITTNCSQFGSIYVLPIRERQIAWFAHTKLTECVNRHNIIIGIQRGFRQQLHDGKQT